jgi:hypothetical protein
MPHFKLMKISLGNNPLCTIEPNAGDEFKGRVAVECYWAGGGLVWCDGGH